MTAFVSQFKYHVNVNFKAILITMLQLLIKLTEASTKAKMKKPQRTPTPFPKTVTVPGRALEREVSPYNKLWFAHAESVSAGVMKQELAEQVMTLIRAKMKTSRLKLDESTMMIIFDRINKQWLNIKPVNGPTGVAALYTAYISRAMLQQMRAQR